MARTDEALARSLRLLSMALEPDGFVASPSFEHYGAVWARDAALTCLGASRSQDDALVRGAEATLRTLGATASPTGQIANAFWPSRRYWDWGEAGAADPSAWFVIALGEHVRATGRTGVAEELWSPMTRALKWLASQDATGTGLVGSAAAGDWMDSSLNRSGRVFHVNVLYHWALRAANDVAAELGRGSVGSPERVADAIDGLFWPRPGGDLAELAVATYPPDAVVRFPHPLAATEYARLGTESRRHYLASVSYGRFVDRCDVLAHCLAIASGLVSGDRAASILDYLDERMCDEPFPSKTWPDPFSAADPDSLLDATADALQAPQWRNAPGSYHNGAVWPYVGAVHACAAAVAGRGDRASALLEGVAEANALDDWGFREWIRVPDGAPSGSRNQTWNAGALLWAHSVMAGG